MNTSLLMVGLAVVAVGLTGRVVAQSGRHTYSPLHITVNDDGKDRTIKAEATDEKGSTYLLREVNDKVVEFKVNGVAIAKEDYNKYVDVFDQIEDWADAPPVPPVPPIPPIAPVAAIAPVTPVATMATPAIAPVALVPPVPPVPPTVGYFVEHIIRDLRREKLIEKTDPLSFTLDNEGFSVNGVKQPAEVFKRYKEKYLEGSKDYFIYDHHGGSTHTEVSTDRKAPEFI
jgi:hypothetical protein